MYIYAIMQSHNLSYDYHVPFLYTNMVSLLWQAASNGFIFLIFLSDYPYVRLMAPNHIVCELFIS